MAEVNDSVSSRCGVSRGGYRRLLEEMLSKIGTGEWAFEKKIPTVNELTASCDYSRMTVVRALQELKQSGHIETRGKLGTFVTRDDQRPLIGILGLFHFSGKTHVEFSSCVTEYVQTELASQGFESVLYQEDRALYPKGIPSDHLRDDLAQGRLHGLITVASNMPVMVDRYPSRWKDLAVPLVNVGSQSSQYRVYVDQIAALTLALQLIQKSGRDRVALITSDEELAGHFVALARQGGLHVCPEWVQCIAATEAEHNGFEALLRLLDGDERPDSLYVSDDVVASGVAQAAIVRKICVPDELLIVSAANKQISRFTPVPLTWMEFDVQELARRSVDLLKELLAGQAPPEANLLVKPKISMNETGDLQGHSPVSDTHVRKGQRNSQRSVAV